MDSKGRPTRLEDIISAGELIAQMGLDRSDRSSDPMNDKEIFDNPKLSNELIKKVEKFIGHKFDVSPQLVLGTVLMPKQMVMAMVTALLICVDKTIMARAECDELREMADR